MKPPFAIKKILINNEPGNNMTLRKLRFFKAILLLTVLAVGYGTVPARATVCTTLPETNAGFLGEYYTPGTLPGDPRVSATPSGTLWFQGRYLQFTRADNAINLGTGFRWPNFLGVHSTDKNAPLLAAHWRATATALDSGTFTFTLNSKGDAWLLVNGITVARVSEGKTPSSKAIQVGLTNGRHQIDVYFGSRTKTNQNIGVALDKRLTYNLPAGACPTVDGVGQGGPIVGPTPNPIPVPTTEPVVQTLSYSRASSLRKAQGTTTIYAVYADGYKWPVGGPSSFARYGYAYSRVQTVSPQALRNLPNVVLVRTPANPTVYAVLFDSKSRRWRVPLLTPGALAGYPATAAGQIRVVDDLDLAGIPLASLVKADGDSAVYLLQDNERHAFLNWSVFLDLGQRPEDIVIIPAEHLNTFPLGDPLG